MSTTAQFAEFLAARPIAVVGATNDRSKYGNIVLRDLLARGGEVYPINPRATTVEGEPAYAALGDCPRTPALAVMVTPPAITLRVLEQAAAAGVPRIWVQPGAGDGAVQLRAGELGLALVDGCIMVQARLAEG